MQGDQQQQKPAKVEGRPGAEGRASAEAPRPQGMAAVRPRPAEKRRFVDVFSHAVHQLRFVLWGVLIAVAVLLVAWFVWGAVNQRRATEAAQKAEAAQTVYASWSSETDATKKAGLEKQLLADLDGIINSFPRQYGAQRALLLRADLRYELKDWARAEADYRDLAKRSPKSYLAPIALYNAAVCLEGEGKAADAKALYERIALDWKEDAIAPRALFDAGRLAEAAGDWTAAQQHYEQIDAQWPTSQWDALAKNRLIALKVAGKIQSSATTTTTTP